MDSIVELMAIIAGMDCIDEPTRKRAREIALGLRVRFVFTTKD